MGQLKRGTSMSRFARKKRRNGGGFERLKIQNMYLLPKQARARRQKATLYKSQLLSPFGSIATGSIPTVQRGPDDAISPQLMMMLKARKRRYDDHDDRRPEPVRPDWQEFRERR